MSVQVVGRRLAVTGQHRLVGEPIYFSRLCEPVPDPLTLLAPDMDDAGVPGWRLRQPPLGVTSLFFATGPEKPDIQLIDAALRTIHMLALDQDSYSITVEVRWAIRQREPVLDVYIGR